MENKPSYYSIIPASVRYCEDLPPGSKLLYGEITALCNKEGFCWANNYYFSKLYQVDKKTVSRWINQLTKHGFLRSEVNDQQGNSRKIFISDAYLNANLKEINPGTLSTEMSIGIHKNVHRVSPEMSIPYPQECPEGTPKIVYNNNTINNKDIIKENRGFALDFLKENFPIRFQEFKMQNKKQIKNWDKFCLDFNDTVEIESLEFTDRKLFGRLGKWARNWIENQERFSPKEEEIIKPVYLRKCN